jgi:hypothetical protein
VLSQSCPALRAATVCTVNAIVRSDQVRYVGLQIRSYANNYAVARFDLAKESVASFYLSRGYGVVPRGDGLVHIWASFDTENGTAAPAVFLQLLDANGKTPAYAGANRTLYFSEIWVNEGLAATAMPRKEASLASTAPGGEAANDVLSLGGIDCMSPNDCSGTFAFQYRDGIQDEARIWQTAGAWPRTPQPWRDVTWKSGINSSSVRTAIAISVTARSRTL